MTATENIEDVERMGVKVKRLRLIRGLSQHQLAAIAKISQPSIAAIEKGTRPTPRPSTIKKLAASLDVSVEHLYGWK